MCRIVLVLLSVLLASLVLTTTPHAGQALTKSNIVLILTDDQSYESVAKMPYVSSRGSWLNYPRAYIENACVARRAPPS